MNKNNNLDLFRSHSFVGHLNKSWLKQDVPRYQINLEDCQANKSKSDRVKNASTNFAAFVVSQNTRKKAYELEKITLHASSGKLLQFPNNSSVIDLAFSTIGCQTPTKIYSRKSIAGFKLSKSALLGAKSTLRNLAKYEFYYKFYFLGSSEPKANLLAEQFRITLGEQKHQLNKRKTTSLAIKNVFVFNELDNLDYDTFSNLTGFEIHLINRCLK